MTARDVADKPPPRRRPSRAVVSLLGCCVCLGVAFVCSTAALVLVARHYLHDAAAAGRAVSTPSATRTPPRAARRLSGEARPLHYDLVLRPKLDEGSYTGQVTITLRLSSPRSSVLLHSANLSIDAVDLTHLNASRPIPVLNVREHLDDDLLEVVTKQTLKKGLYELRVKFAGSMDGNLRGLYRSRYKDGRGVRIIATSKFEPTYARQAFPCFDEPNMKATYTVRILRPNDSDYTALSNMPEVSSVQQSDGVLVTFQESVKMSTYLVCFIVSDFKYTENLITDENIPFRVFATPEQLEKTEYAKDIGKTVIEFYIEYFSINFPLPKLDMAAIPDFVSGAMEHWGLVTFRETSLLYSNTTHSSANKQRVASVVAHELAHSWFGNLVTMNWWNDLWLNEGFASYIEYKGVDAAEPDWNMMDHFLIDDLHAVLNLDATLSSHPIVQTVTTPDEITAIFDTISYNKGASVLRMLEDAVGGDVFRQSVTNYLNNHAYGNAVTQDLLNEIQKIVGDEQNITQFMDTWTIQMGFPVVTVKKDGSNYVLTQSRFLLDPNNTDNWDTSLYNYKWTIPITYITDVNPNPTQFWFEHSAESLTIPIPTGVNWVKFNYKQVGYYRVNYDDDTWEDLTSHYSEFTVADRTHLVEETFSLAQAGQISYNIPLGLTKALKNELDYVPWSAASSTLKELKQYLTTSKYYTDFKSYVSDVVNTSYLSYGWNESDNDSHLTKRARTAILDLACSMDHTDCLAEAKTRLENWLNEDASEANTLSQDLRSVIYVYGMIQGTAEMWHKLWDRFVAESDSNEKLKLLRGLASIRDSTLLNRILTLAEDETYIRSQDYFTCVRYIAANEVGTPIVWDYVRENWPQLVSRFTLNDRTLGQLIPSITSSFATETKLEEMRAFFAKYPEAGAGAAQRTKALETISNNMKWLQNYKTAVETWLESNATV